MEAGVAQEAGRLWAEALGALEDRVIRTGAGGWRWAQRGRQGLGFVGRFKQLGDMILFKETVSVASGVGIIGGDVQRGRPGVRGCIQSR